MSRAARPSRTPSRTISASPRVTSAARALRPSASPSRDARRDRDHVLHGAAQFHADQVGAGVDPQAGAVELRGGRGSEVAVARGEHDRGGLPARHLEREAGPGKHAGQRARAGRTPATIFVGKLVRVLLEALAGPQQLRGGDVAADRRGGVAQPRRGGGDDDEVAAGERRAEAGFDANAPRESGPRGATGWRACGRSPRNRRGCAPTGPPRGRRRRARSPAPIPRPPRRGPRSSSRTQTPQRCATRAKPCCPSRWRTFTQPSAGGSITSSRTCL